MTIDIQLINWLIHIILYEELLTTTTTTTPSVGPTYVGSGEIQM